ncbi:hypothetical protein HMPREF3151_04575 [Corynebacterium sp. HMSC05H05]|uniref:hypothetical protein n=1 Tax=unclassified Corynebacterium TaxID=2624378 RepID=UPI0008A3989C|nr:MULTISPECIES: hypothetical protein [unclassified Corynebacterium]OFT58459.1 hypothetical protein HMPREF3151_04575 [Corynebacterium sp. HMSC05H05]OHR19875.1 hypothetical protein HMPREF2791_11135 [Corynebacterium sp. HMSC034A01]
MRVGVFLLSLTLTLLGIWVAPGFLGLAYLFCGTALVIGCVAATQVPDGSVARKVGACGLVIAAAATPWVLPIAEGLPAGAGIVLGLFGPAVSFLALAWAYLLARRSKLWHFLAALGLAIVLAVAPHRVMIRIAHLLWENPLIGYLWAGMVFAIAIASFLLVVWLNRRNQKRRAGTDHRSEAAHGPN